MESSSSVTKSYPARGKAEIWVVPLSSATEATADGGRFEVRMRCGGIKKFGESGPKMA